MDNLKHYELDDEIERLSLKSTAKFDHEIIEIVQNNFSKFRVRI